MEELYLEMYEVQLKGACLVGASAAERTVYVFHNIRNESRYNKILHYVLRIHMEGTKKRGRTHEAVL